MVLQRELETFRRELPRLLAEGHDGKFGLFHGTTLDSLWPTEDEALSAGYDRFGLDPFLVKEVTGNEKVFYFAWNVKSCPM